MSRWSRNIDLVSIALTPRGGGLGPTNPPRITLAAEPSGFRWWGFAPHFSVTRSGIRSRERSTAGFRCRFCALATLPYHAGEPASWASARRFAPLDSRRSGTRPVSCYALFQGWLLLSQPPGCLGTATTLTTQRRFGGLSRRSGLFPSRRTTFAPHVSLRLPPTGIRSLPSLGRR
jgi:hypothetical protein